MAIKTADELSVEEIERRVWATDDGETCTISRVELDALLCSRLAWKQTAKCFSLAGRWMKIDTAPKDDTCFLAGLSDGRIIIVAGSMLVRMMRGDTPNHLQFPATHWMPLPPSPPVEG